MKKLVTTSKIDLNLRAPGSKSIAQRAIISALLSKGVSTLTGVTLCDDTAAAISLIKRLGADVSFSDDDSKCIINSSFDINGSIPENLTCNESGLLSRTFFATSTSMSNPFSFVLLTHFAHIR